VSAQTAHTALPWWVDPNHGLCIESLTGNVGLLNLARACEADALLIVTAVNYHDKLMAMLWRAEKELAVAREFVSTSKRYSYVGQQLYEKVRAESESLILEVRNYKGTRP
jgi:hypothetical protein